MEKIKEANSLVSQAFELVYQDAKEKAPTLKNPKYGWFNKGNAAVYMGVSRPTFNAWVEKYHIPRSVVDGIIRYSKADLDKFMNEHKRS